MTQSHTLYLMLHQGRDYGELVSGPNPAAAVEAYYAEMDAWCAPSPDAEISEEFTVWLYEVPSALEDHIQLRFEDLDTEEFTAAAAAFIAENPNLKAVELNVIYTAAEGTMASEMPRLPDLFDRAREG
ncbi:hypothetical protein [Aminobacter sp. Piv2-1]|uniref:hypothetical protein n=1 Tax=Aminobacter sp. Piv2-1 TaxID=3031122 RepID=UPI0030AC282D